MSAVTREMEESSQAPADTSTSILERIRESIAMGRLPLGARISDKQLAQDLSVSRTPVREALLRLKAEGLVEIKPRSGTFIFEPSADDIRALCAARAILESGAVRLLSASGNPEVFAPMHRLVGEAALALEEGDLAACDRLDWRFHEALFAATANTYLVSAYLGLATQMRALRQRMPQSRKRIEQAIAQHRRILDLMSNDRDEEAAAHMGAHVQNVERLLVGD